MGYERYQYIKVEKEENVAIVTLNRPERLNAFIPPMHREVEDIWPELEEDEDVRAIVFTGAGDRAFSAGGDVKNMAAHQGDPKAAVDTIYGNRRLIRNFLFTNKPLVCAMNGHAIGVACTLALLSDIVIAAEDAKIGDTHAPRGIVPGDGGVVIWPLLVGLNRAKEYLMTGDLMTGKQAAEMGLVNRALPQDQVYPEAMKLAKRLAEGAPLAIQWTKLALNQIIWAQINSSYEVALGLEAITVMSEDQHEGATAWLEKRKPVFKGR